MNNIRPKNIAVIGTSGAIGNAFKNIIVDKYPVANLYTFSRTGEHVIDYSNEESIIAAADLASKDGPLDLVIVAIGILHDGDIMPEKSLKELSAEKFNHLFKVNTITPALIAKHFLPKLNRDYPSRFAALSAKNGSISGNQLGGWYAYRTSKSALNMVIKNAAIEIGRRNKQAVIVGLDPGTVDSRLSKPFKKYVPDGKLFTPEYSAQKLLEVLESLMPEQSGKCFSWEGKEILP